MKESSRKWTASKDATPTRGRELSLLISLVNGLDFMSIPSVWEEGVGLRHQSQWYRYQHQVPVE